MNASPYSPEMLLGYRLLSPILMLPRVWIQFLAASFSWVFLAIAAVWAWNTTIYWLPTFGLVAFALIVPFQESQVFVISILELVFENLSFFFDDILFPIIEDFLYIVQPVCWAYNFLWDLIIPVFKIAIFNPLKLVLLMAFPTNPFEVFQDVKIQADSLNFAFTINTASSPDWVVGPYDKRTASDQPDSAPSSRRVLDKEDPINRALVEWLDRHEYTAETGHGRLYANRPGVVGLVLFPGELEAWTDGGRSVHARRAIAESLLRRAIDRAVGLESPSWWERLDPLGERKVKDMPPTEDSRWERVFNLTEYWGALAANADSIGVARLDSIPKIPPHMRDGPQSEFVRRVPEGSVAYRFVAMGPERHRIVARDHSFPIFQTVAQFLNILIGGVARVIVELIRIAAKVGAFLFTNLEDFFTNAFDFMANLFNQIFKEFLNLPCLQFDSFAVFAISLMDCICGPITDVLQGLGLEQWFNYERPTQLSDAPQALLGCIGLGCLDIEALSANPLSFLAVLFKDCANLGDNVACCVSNPIGCLMNMVVHMLPCTCPNNWDTITAPECNWMMGDPTRWLRCIVAWIGDQIDSGCFNSGGGCPALNDISQTLTRCIWRGLRKHINAIKKLLKLIDDIPFRRSEIPSEDGYYGREEKGQIESASASSTEREGPWQPPPVAAPGYSEDAARTPPSVAESRRQRLQSQCQGNTSLLCQLYNSQVSALPQKDEGEGVDRGIIIDGSSSSSSTGSTTMEKFDRTALVARYGPSAVAEVENLLSQGDAGGQFDFERDPRAVVDAVEMRLLEAMDDDGVVLADSSSSSSSISSIIINGSATTTATTYDYTEGGSVRPLKLVKLGLTGLSGLMGTTESIASPFMQLLSSTVGGESRSRHRARTQAFVDRRLYSNPYIRAATGRLFEIARDLTDFVEFRVYGADPFIQPSYDADPQRDIRAVHREMLRVQHQESRGANGTAKSPRSVDYANDKGDAYAMHVQDVLDNPYYAGLYKVFFQVGAPGSVADNLETWRAMAEHVNDPYFHAGRIMSASRQILAAYGSVFKEVWWDSDAFSFHFPDAPQITEIYHKSHLGVFMDDMRSATYDLLYVASAGGEELIDADVAEAAARGAGMHAEDQALFEEQGLDVEAWLDPDGALPLDEQHLTPAAQRYSWVVQAEVSARTIVTRLLAPEYLTAVLEETATSSPLHAKYAHRMQERVALLEEVTQHSMMHQKHQLDTLVAQFRADVLRKDKQLRGHGFRGIQLAEPLDLEEDRKLWTRDGTGSNTTRIDQRDGNWDYYGNGETFYEGQRIRFPDGHTATFMGTTKKVTERVPVLDAVARSGVMGSRSAVVSREPVILTIIGAVWSVLGLILANWEIIATFAMTLLASPPARVFWETWAHFAFVRLVKPLYMEGLLSLFSDAMNIVFLIQDFAILNTTIILFLVNEIFRFLLCWAWGFIFFISIVGPIAIVLAIIQVGWFFIIVLGLIIGFIVFLFPYCPPPQVIINGRMQQSPFQYVDDVVKCFGETELGAITIGKDAYNNVCSTKFDCPGNAPCICPNKGGQLQSIFIQFTDDTACGTEQAPTGQCICWPKMGCQFMLPRLDLGRFFDVDCADEYGYRNTGITWYQTSDYFLIAYNIYRNFWVGLTYIVRILTLARQLNPIFFFLIVGFAAIIIFYADTYLGVVILGVLAFYEYLLPVWNTIVIELLVPGANTVVGSGIWPFPTIADWLIGFVRFPNHSAGNPLGSPGSGEGVCFIFNLPTTIGGAAVTFWFWALVLAALWYGAGALFWLLFHHLMVPVRMVGAVIWYLLWKMRHQRRVDALAQNIRMRMPSWLKRGASKTKAAGGAVWQYITPIGAAMTPQGPQGRLNDWIVRHVPAPLPQSREGVPLPETIDGRERGLGGGILTREIYTTSPAGSRAPPIRAGVPPSQPPPEIDIRHRGGRRRQPRDWRRAVVSGVGVPEHQKKDRVDKNV